MSSILKFHRPRHLGTAWLALSTALLLQACGGGGGGEDSTSAEMQTTAAEGVSTIQTTPPPPTGGYSFRSTATAAFSAKCLDVPQSRAENGLQLIQWDCNGGLNQVFDFSTPYGNTSNAEYTLSSPTSGKCMVALNGGSGNGTPVVQGACTQAEVWRHFSVDLVNKVFQLRSVRTGRCLDVEGANPSRGAKLILWDCKSSNNTASAANQAWHIPGRYAGID